MDSRRPAHRPPSSERLHVLFVHGMGRTPLSSWPMLRRLRQSGLQTHTFGYVAALETFDNIVARLIRRIEAVSNVGRYLVVGHSLGGVLLRAALNKMDHSIRRPEHLFLLGSPIVPARLAIRLRNSIAYRLLTGDCGQLLSSEERMRAIGPIDIPTTAIAGVRGTTSRLGPFAGDANDGVVAVSEVRADWFARLTEVPVLHTFLPSSQKIAAIILSEPTAATGN
ncbi:MAG: esterase/lipase family protein [Pseudomarimonas sp.]